MSRLENYRAYVASETDPVTLQGLASMQRRKVASGSAEIERLRAQLAEVEAGYGDIHKMLEVTASRRRELADGHLKADAQVLSAAATPSDNATQSPVGSVDHELTAEIDDATDNNGAG